MTSEPIRPWDVIVVPFPYSERLAEKRRPALVVSGDALHREGYVWSAMITGAGKPERVGDVRIFDLTAAGLPGASIVRASSLATVEPERILRRVGLLAAGERKAVRSTLAALLAA